MAPRLVPKYQNSLRARRGRLTRIRLEHAEREITERTVVHAHFARPHAHLRLGDAGHDRLVATHDPTIRPAITRVLLIDIRPLHLEQAAAVQPRTVGGGRPALSLRGA